MPVVGRWSAVPWVTWLAWPDLSVQQATAWPVPVTAVLQPVSVRSAVDCAASNHALVTVVVRTPAG